MQTIRKRCQENDPSAPHPVLGFVPPFCMYCTCASLYCLELPACTRHVHLRQTGINGTKGRVIPRVSLGPPHVLRARMGV